MNGPVDSVRIDSESDEFSVVSVVAVPPSRRDVWAILRGRYRAKVVKRETVTLAGMARELKRTWTNAAMESVLYSSPLSELFDGKTGTVPIKKRP